ncbi:endoplasmic reticulum resident protein 29 [Melitaea cinxia]|uniref:endoplasmic reticulum resident protein 29 n=1 Tax=Melitaea cinxia TaxID=113334 RepID=UPI001E270E4C|nr:endoplasmic reticulum resident protein 29 [Melitaea cinxia]
MKRLIAFVCVILAVPSTYLASTSISGSVELDEYTFDKVISKFAASVVKFDVAFPYGDKHDAFVALAKESKDIDDLLFAEVGVKDYGDRDNEALALKYGASKENFPNVKLFLKGKSEPIAFDDTKGFTTESLRRFIRDKSEIYLSLPGCIKDLDLLAIKFKDSDVENRKHILKEAENVLEKLKSKDSGTGKIYITLMKKVLEKGDDFIGSEVARVKKILDDKISDKKRHELNVRLNILQSFTFNNKTVKEEL